MIVDDNNDEKIKVKHNRGMRSKTGMPPGSLMYTGEASPQTAILRGMDYDASSFTELDPATMEDLLKLKNSEAVTWIQVVGLRDETIIEQIGNCFGIHPLVMEDILEANHRPKLEDYGDYLYIILRAFHSKDKSYSKTEQISMIIGENYVLTFHDREDVVFDTLRNRLREGKGRLRTLGADYLAYAILDVVVDNYFDVVEHLGESIEELEDKLVLEPSRNTLQKIHRLKHAILVLRKAVWPLRDAIGALSRGESALIQSSTLLYLRDVYDHTIQVIDTLETYRDLLSGMLDIYLSSISNHMNQIMKVLTIISTIFIPLTFIVGIYGMNFKYMPELEWEWGYPAVWGVMALITLGMINFFRRRKWL